MKHLRDGILTFVLLAAVALSGCAEAARRQALRAQAQQRCFSQNNCVMYQTMLQEEQAAAAAYQAWSTFWGPQIRGY